MNSDAFGVGIEVMFFKSISGGGGGGGGGSCGGGETGTNASRTRATTAASSSGYGAGATSAGKLHVCIRTARVFVDFSLIIPT